MNKKHQKTIIHTYVHSDPIANVFSVINQYSVMAKSHVTPKTLEQLISIGKIIITNANIF